MTLELQADGPAEEHSTKQLEVGVGIARINIALPPVMGSMMTGAEFTSPSSTTSNRRLTSRVVSSPEARALALLKVNMSDGG